MTNLDSILKSRDITLPTKVHLVKAMIFPVVMYGCKSCTIKKAESWRIDIFELWCWTRLLRVPLTAGRPNQSILKEISLEYSLSWNSNPLATWCEELTHLKRPWCWERLKVGEGDDRGWDGWMASQTQWTWIWVNSRSWWWTWRPGVLQSMRWQRFGHYWATELNWDSLSGASGKDPPARAGDIKWSRVWKVPGGGQGNSLEYSCLENPLDWGAWGATVHRVTKSWTQLKWLNTKHTAYIRTILIFTSILSLWWCPDNSSNKIFLYDFERTSRIYQIPFIMI